MKIVNILWSGGWDSTFRAVSLADKEVANQPYYLCDNRQSEEIELNTIHTIQKDLLHHSTTKCTFLPIILYPVKDIAPDRDITRDYHKVLKTDFFGSQYDWLARFAKTIDNLELSIHQDDTAYVVIQKYGKLISHNDPVIGQYYTIDPEASSPEVNRLFGNFRFPMLEMSKLDMKEWAERNGYTEIMYKTWFCHKPRNGKSCGTCNPCIYTIEEGLGERLDDEALRRYRINKRMLPLKNTFVYRGVRKIYRTVITPFK